MNNEEREHPSFGLIGWSRIQVGGGMELFGSPMRHSEVIALRIHKAEHVRDLNHDWYHSKELVTEIYISPAQFADFMTTPNQGDGVPCTLKTTQEEGYIEPPSFEPQVEIFNRELKQDMEDIRAMAERLRTEVMPVLKNSKAKKADRETAANVAFKLSQEIIDNLPYTHESLGKAMQKTVTAAKSEVESFMNRRIYDAGLEHLKSELPKLTDSKEEEK